MKKLILIFSTIYYSTRLFAVLKKIQLLQMKYFIEAQKAGKTIVINSWNKSCWHLCGTVQTKVLNKSKK